ncbi:FtsZ/tubulin family protein [Pyramidobacter piscolens]|uniref:hypothetical protein n=1 Tax=Pyramidobacter piscolens TaxID=638849 RepID=UPI002AAF2A37|nr:hypothetical protein [Pyramidobacter piscolens]
MILESTRALLRLFKTVEPNTHLSPGGITELEAVPAIVLEGPEPIEAMDMRRAGYKIEVYDDDTETFVREPAPRFFDLRFTVSLSTDNVMELLRLLERCSQLAHNLPLLQAAQETTGREREYSWEWERFPTGSGAPNVSEVCEAVGTLKIRDVEVFSGERVTGPYITKVKTDIRAERSLDDGD